MFKHRVLNDNVPPSKVGYNIMKVYGIETNGGGVLVDSDKKEYGIFNYTGHIGGAHYFYIKPGTYTIKSLSANQWKLYLFGVWKC